jgi:hypothetical protein
MEKQIYFKLEHEMTYSAEYFQTWTDMCGQLVKKAEQPSFPIDKKRYFCSWKIVRYEKIYIFDNQFAISVLQRERAIHCTAEVPGWRRLVRQSHIAAQPCKILQ